MKANLLKKMISAALAAVIMIPCIPSFGTEDDVYTLYVSPSGSDNAAGGENERAALVVHERANGIGDAIAVVSDNTRNKFDILSEQIDELLFDFDSAEVRSLPGVRAVADGKTADSQHDVRNYAWLSRRGKRKKSVGWRTGVPVDWRTGVPVDW